MELRKAGATYDAIAKELGYRGPSGAYKSVMSAIRKTLQEPADEVRTLELERLDALMLSAWREAVSRRGKLEAIDRVLKIMARRAKLLGLDAPDKKELSGPEGGPVEVIHARGKLLAAIEREMEEPEREPEGQDS